MNEPLAINLGVYHTQALAQISAYLGNGVTVSAYQRYGAPENPMPRRLVALELTDAPASNPADIGTEQWQAELKFSAEVSISYLEVEGGVNPKLEVRKLAMRLAGWIYGQRFDCPVGPAREVSAGPSEFTIGGKDGDADDYEVWRVEWSHEALVNESVWDSGTIIALPDPIIETT